MKDKTDMLYIKIVAVQYQFNNIYILLVSIYVRVFKFVRVDRNLSFKFQKGIKTEKSYK